MQSYDLFRIKHAFPSENDVGYSVYFPKDVHKEQLPGVQS